MSAMLLAMDWQPTLLGIAALLTAFGGVISTIMAVRKARSDGEAECLDRLKKSRAEAEGLAEELHKLRMEQSGGGGGEMA
jgi:hypothetical protein